LKPPERPKTLRRALVVGFVLITCVVAGVLPAFTPAPVRAETAGDTGADGSSGSAAGLGALIAEAFSLITFNSALTPDPAQVAENAIRGMVQGLRDYYASYYTPEAMDAFVSSVHGSFGGIGVEIGETDERYLKVIAVMPGMPADKAGMLAGDVITAVDGVDIKGKGLEAAPAIRGEPGTQVVLTVRREGRAEPLTFTLTRELIKMVTVESEMLDGQVGYIRITSFDEDTDQEMDEALLKLAGAGARGLVIDLRDNPGGMLSSCAGVVGRFLPPKYPYLRVEWTWRTDVYKVGESEGFTPLEGFPYEADGSFPYPVAVLVNRNTASAAEILASSLQEWGVARVFGEKTYGKGCVQSLYSLSSGAGVKITTATWSTGLGHELDGVGVAPDEVLSGMSPPQEPDFIPISDQWVFRRGSVGSDVVCLQMRLNQLGYKAGPEDGVFSAATEAALKEFQAAAKLPRTGVSDKATAGALNGASLADHPAGKPKAPVATGPANPSPPKLTGDKPVDRCAQWLNNVLAGKK
jgi:carboxyl-terminal processing protease